MFDPEGRLQPQLQGYRRTATGQWRPWQPGARGELVSKVLGLTLIADGELLRLENADGQRLPTPNELHLRAASTEAQLQEEQARSARLQEILRQHGIPFE